MTKSPSSSSYISCVKIYCDGACRKNPGPSSIGVVLYDQDFSELERFARLIGTSTSNAAEYEAVIAGLDTAAKYTRMAAECFIDSDVVEGQVTGRYRLRNHNLRQLFHQVKDHERPFNRVTYCRVNSGDQRLAIAHKIAHDALNGR